MSSDTGSMVNWDTGMVQGTVLDCSVAQQGLQYERRTFLPYGGRGYE